MGQRKARLTVGEGISVWVLDAPGGLGNADVHAHHAIQISVALDGVLMLSTPSASLRAPALAVAADAPHRIDVSGLFALIFVEPESRWGRALASALFDEGELVEVRRPDFLEAAAPLRKVFSSDVTGDQVIMLGRQLVALLAPPEAPRLPDARIQRILDHAAANLDSTFTLAQAAEGIALSPSRLRHLFVEQTGVKFKTYLLWLRLVRAVQIYSEGAATLTEAAHAAGFADSAHFSRVFRRTFGSPATALPRF